MSVELKERILEATTLHEIISAHVSLRRVGSNHRGLCPFHNENTPSFYVFSDHFHCFGCGAHGDAIEYVKRHYGLDFIESLKWLAHKAGIDAQQLSERGGSSQLRKAALIAQNILAQSQHIFTNELWTSSPRAQKARQYLISSRGLDADFLKKHGFGLAPEGKQHLYKTLSKQGFSHQDLLKASLISPHGASYQDFFQNRIIFPIESHQGKLLAFAGRVFGENQKEFPKYKNSRYNKSSVLYGYHRARQTIRTEKKALVAEGYMDVLRLWSCGFTGSVACQGTALTLPHLKALARITPQIILLFDGDQAGEQAALRTLGSALAVPELDVWRLRLPAGEDPDSFLQKNSRQDFEDLLQNAQPLLEDIILSKLKKTPAAAVPGMLQKDYLPWVKSLPSSLQQESMLVKIADLTGLPHGTLRQALHATSLALPSPHSAHLAATEEEVKTEEDASIPPLDPLSQEFLTHLFYATAEDGLHLDQIQESISRELELSDSWLEYFQSMVQLLKEDTSPHSISEDNAPELWRSPQGVDIIRDLRQRKERFSNHVHNRHQALELILHRNSQLRTKKQINQLKQELSAMSRKAVEVENQDDIWTDFIAQLSSSYKSVFDAASRSYRNISQQISPPEDKLKLTSPNTKDTAALIQSMPRLCEELFNFSNKAYAHILKDLQHLSQNLSSTVSAAENTQDLGREVIEKVRCFHEKNLLTLSEAHEHINKRVRLLQENFTEQHEQEFLQDAHQVQKQTLLTLSQVHSDAHTYINGKQKELRAPNTPADDSWKEVARAIQSLQRSLFSSPTAPEGRPRS